MTDEFVKVLQERGDVFLFFIISSVMSLDDWFIDNYMYW